MTFNPLLAVGLVFLGEPKPREIISGTCFLFRQDHVALTAAHCIPQDDSVRVLFPALPRAPQQVKRVVRHPSADIAALFIEPDHGESAEGYPDIAFWHEVGNFAMGEEFFAGQVLRLL